MTEANQGHPISRVPHCNTLHVDPATGLAAVIMMQHLPFFEAAALATYEAFERAVYAEV